MKAIPKLQQGGFAGLFANYTPIMGTQPKAQQPQQRASAPSSRGGGNDGKLTEKDLFELMKDVKGLPNDMAALVKNLYEMYTVQVMSGDTQNLAAIYLQNLMQLKNNVFNQEEYKKAYEQVKAQGGLNEYAITTNGKLVVQDRETKQLHFMSADEIKDSTNDNLQILTNSNLLSLRANSPGLVNDNSVLQIVENGIGMEQIAKMVQERLQSLGTDEIQYKGQTVRLNGQLQAGAEILGALADNERIIFDGSTKLEGLHSWELLNKTQQKQARQALRWIINSLPDNAKTLLTVKAGSEGNVESLIMSLIQSRVSETRHFTTNFEKTWDDLTGEGKGKGKSKGNDDEDSMEDVKFNTASEWLKGYGVSEQFIINPGSNNAFSVIANRLQLTSSDNNPLGAGKTLLDAASGGYSGILNISQATMGGKRIKSSLLDWVFLDDGMIYSIDFPVTADGIPDLRKDTLQRKKQAEETIKAYGIDLKNPDSIRTNYSRINQIYQSFGFSDPVYNSDGSVNQKSWRRFGVINAKADGRALGTDIFENNQLLSPITDDDEIKALTSQIKKDNKDYTFDNNKWIGDDDNFYRGTVWIPIDESFIAAQAGTGEKFTTQTGLQMNIQDQYLKLGSQATRNLNITTNQPR